MKLLLLDGFFLIDKNPTKNIGGYGCDVEVFSSVNEGDFSSYIYKKDSPFEEGLNWRCIKIDEILDFDLSGVLVKVLAPLSNANISVLVISSFDTDYILFKNDDCSLSLSVLNESGFDI